MKKAVLFFVLSFVAVSSFSQITYVSAQSGNYDANTTWGPGGAPPTSSNCNCKIVIAANHTVTLNVAININTVALVLDGPGSKLQFGTPANLTMTLGGTSSIDIQSTTASIVLSKNGQAIILKGQTIFTNNSTGFNSPTQGTVNGLASAASVRANPQFQSGTLPVRLSDFSATSKGSGITLSWKTDLEVNSSHFEVERSSEGKEWNTIASIQAAGNINVQQSYSYIDPAPLDGDNYYRLKIVDIDGQFEYSSIKSVNVKSVALNVVASPNPVSSLLNITVNQPGREPYRLRLINRAGQVVFDQKYAAANNRIQLNVSNYTDGSYFLEVTSHAGLRQINKVMIVRK